MSKPLHCVVLSPPHGWVEPDEEDPPSPWRETWDPTAEPGSGSHPPDLVVAPSETDIDRLKRWRKGAREVPLLWVIGERDGRIGEFFGDQGVFFLRPVASRADLRAGLREVLSYQDACLEFEAAGELPPLEETQPVSGWVELTAPNHPVFLRRFRAWIQGLDSLPLGATERKRLVHAVREVGWNALEWGNHFDPRRRLSLSVLALSDRVVFRVEDEGTGGGDFGSQSLPADLKTVQEQRASCGIRPGGLGLALVARLMDRVEVSARGNVVVLEKRLPLREPPTARVESEAAP